MSKLRLAALMQDIDMAWHRCFIDETLTAEELQDFSPEQHKILFDLNIEEQPN